ncbi:MAG: Rha family transcriptional regulator [Peptostreptococcaceae bacterium]|nr:Rha family transcriptional regulator [Peptostreptococcaceae bacterium]
MEIVKIANDKRYGFVVSSRVIADRLKKRHSDVIESLDKISENGNLRSLIIPTFYKVEGQKRRYKEYLLTKDGFTLYMFNIQGHNDFKIAYIEKFNEMEQALKGAKALPERRIKPKAFRGDRVMTISDISEMLGIHRATVNDYLIHSGISYRLLRGEEIKQFFRENPGENKASTLHVLSYSMVRDLLDLLGVWNEHKKKVQAYFGPEEAERSKSGIEKMERVMFRFKRIFAAKELQAFAHRHSMDTDLRKRLLEIVDEILVREEVYDRVDGEFNPVTPQGHRKAVIYNYLPYIAARGEISISAIDEFAEYIRGQVKALERK